MTPLSPGGIREIKICRSPARFLAGDLGVPDTAAAAWLGHTKVDVTRGYQHVMFECLNEASKALGDALAE